MKDATDNSTIELFPEEKKRGRPATGKARTAAERQAKSRYKKFTEGNKDNLNIWIDAVLKIRLEKMAKAENCSIAEMVEKMINMTYEIKFID